MAHYQIDLTLNTTAQERAAWNIVRPVLAAHLKKVNRVYKRANESQQEQIRAHCPIFDAVMRLTEDEA